MTRTTMTHVGTLLAIAAFAIAGCSQATPGASAAPTVAGSSAASAAPGSSAAACQDLTAFKASVDELRALDLASLASDGVTAAVADVESAASSLAASAKAEAGPEVEALETAILGLKFAVVNLTSEETLVQKRAEIKAAVVGVDQATTALTTALTVCQ
jgi:hypothetical protein